MGLVQIQSGCGKKCRRINEKLELMETIKRLTIRNIRKWMFDFDYLTLHVEGMELDNTDGRRYLYELEDQDVEVSISLEGNTIKIL
jgi:hypothetical protein